MGSDNGIIDHGAGVIGMSDKQLASEALQILHGGRSGPPAEVARALVPYMKKLRKSPPCDELAHASADAVQALVQSLQENQAASDDLWQEAIEASTSFANATV